VVFLGRYAHNLDTKGRMAVPARYREALAEVARRRREEFG
jgi:DNA-binding transcriptional regulator/RsmH inhibitor MraZ